MYSHSTITRPIYANITYRIVQKVRGTKLLRLDHHVSIRGKTFTFNLHQKRPLLCAENL